MPKKKDKLSEQTKNRLLYTCLGASLFAFVASFFFPDANILGFYGFLLGWLGFALGVSRPGISKVGGSS